MIVMIMIVKIITQTLLQIIDLIANMLTMTLQTSAFTVKRCNKQ